MRHINRTSKALIKNRLTKIREAKGMSKTRLAYLMDLNERTQRRYIGDVEKNNKVQLTVEKAALICVILDCKPEDLYVFDFKLVYKEMDRIRSSVTKRLAKA